MSSHLENLIESLPKAELHLHIEGTLEPEMVFNLAHKNNIKINFNSVEELRSAYKFNNLQSFLNIYYEATNVLVNKSDFYDMTYAYLVRAKKDNIIHTEIFFDPQSHTSRGIDIAIVIKGISEALIEGEKKLGISSKLIMCFLRHLSESDALKVYESMLPYRQYVQGIGLDSSEVGNPPIKFKKVFQRAQDDGFYLVAHAGEEGPPEYIWSVLKDLHVKRIDHGVRAIEDGSLIKYLVEKEIPLTVCPLSNLSLCVVNDLGNHNLKKLLDWGVCVTINSDDPAYFGGYLNQNYLETAIALKLSDSDLILLAKNSIRASQLSSERKSEILCMF